MSLTINSNIPALTAVRNLNKTGDALASSTEKLTTGLKINRAADDAAGLAISTRMVALLGGLNQSVENANAGISLINTADGALGAIANALTNLRQLAVQSANGTLAAGDRASIDINSASLLAQINSVVQQTSFNGLQLIDGSLNTNLQVGAASGNTIALAASSVNTADIGAVVLADVGGGAAIVGGGDLTIDGVNISATVNDGVSTVNPNESAIAIAKAINTSNVNVHAIANPTVTGTTAFSAGTGHTGTITINGVATALLPSLSGTQATDVTSAITSINSLSIQTGVTASANALGNLIFTASDGRNITVAYSGSLVEGDFGAVAAGTTNGNVTLTSSRPIVVGGSGATPAGGFVAGTTSVLTPLSGVNLSIQANAVVSLAIIDGAIDGVSNLRGSLGAIQNRLESAAYTLGNSAVNLQAANSEIIDTDYATEMTNFTKLQILQQAGTAMLSQANSLPKAALKLINGQ